jgi:hypothetical protein
MLDDLWDPPRPGAPPRPRQGRATALWCFGAWAGRRGADPHLFDTGFQGRLAPHVEHQMRTEVWRVNPVYLRYARRITALAARDGVPVFWVVPPIAPEAQAWRDSTGLDGHHTRNLRAALGSLPNVTVVDARHEGYPADLFNDVIHLNARGAARFSTAVATAIRRRLDGQTLPRWVSLHEAATGDLSGLATRPGPDVRR